eukprot:SAG31_NODE_19122_length_611_cov_1.724609_2_plen_29_part_01
MHWPASVEARRKAKLERCLPPILIYILKI